MAVIVVRRNAIAVLMGIELLMNAAGLNFVAFAKYSNVKGGPVDGQVVTAGSVIVRQRGTKFHPGKNVGVGSDYTIFSKIHGLVKFENMTRKKQKISVYPAN